MKKILISVAIIGALSGCQSIESLTSYNRGTNVTLEQMGSFIINKTKRSDIVHALGEPQKITTEEGKKVIEYHYQKISSFSSGIDQAVKFFFNSHSILIDKKTVQGSRFGNPLTGN
jgi:hypothetical protein